jgi:hypothetical protein
MPAYANPGSALGVDEIRSNCVDNGGALPLPLAGEGGVGVSPRVTLFVGRKPPPAALFERVDLPRKRERWSEAATGKPS